MNRLIMIGLICIVCAAGLFGCATYGYEDTYDDNPYYYQYPYPNLYYSPYPYPYYPYYFEGGKEERHEQHERHER